MENIFSAQEFYNWLKNYQFDFEGNFDEEYRKVYNTYAGLFGFVEGWESDFETVLCLNGESLGNWLLEQISKEDRERLTSEYEWDGSWQGLLNYSIGEISFGMEFGGPSSEKFILMFNQTEHKKLVLNLLVASLVLNSKNELELYDISEWKGFKLKNILEKNFF